MDGNVLGAGRLLGMGSKESARAMYSSGLISIRSFPHEYD
jgi:hypothetical protein